MLGSYSYAQLFVGGTVSYMSVDDTLKTTNSNISKGSNLIFMPMVGYHLNEKFSVGSYLLVSSKSETNSSKSLGYTEAKTTMWGLLPFVRYQLLSVNRISLLGQSTVLFVGGSTKYTGGYYNDASFISIACTISPVIQYNFNTNWAIESNLSFLSLTFGTQSTTSKFGATETTSRTNMFKLGINDSQTISAINLGVVYTFN